MKENFKLRKMKVGLVSIAMAAMYITIQGQAEASEHVSSASQPTHNVEQRQVTLTPQQSNESQTNTSVQQVEEEKQTVVKEKQKNFVTLNDVQPGATEITGKTLPNQTILLNIDGKSADAVDSSDSEIVMSNDKGEFTYKLKDRKIVYNQDIDVISSNFNFESEDELEEDEIEASKSVSTGRYANAYQIPSETLTKKDNHHQVLVEPILKDSGIIKGHTSVKGRVAIAINNAFINLGFNDDFDKNTPLAQVKARNEGIWKHIDDKGYFEFDLKGEKFSNHNIKKGDLVSITFKPNDEDEAIIPLIFNVQASDFDSIQSAITSYNPSNVKKVNILNTITDDIQVDDIQGYDYVSNHGIDKPVEGSKGTKVIEGKTKFANAVVNVTSSLREGNEFPDLQVGEDGKFSFNASSAGFRLNNGEKLHFVVVDPLSGKVLSKLVTKEITVAESEDQKKERAFDDLIEITPAYFKLVGNEIRGYDIHGYVLTYFNAYDTKELARHIYKGQ
ncbi:hypothetical protein BU586_09510 [Staphylococcus agnetis]|uniref:hypothetical protein n=1 Tax=Staphylococcus agnetis TaxID=985762 RepID=UPI000D198795|nr:hypothetical protein [Staphylococcus agnetis]MCO4325539.1 hypothetical protein [Staphylococcus agnetis]MCO4339925.1 hypothetical protein [Staphylococcus agnetis]MCO4342309.1 hypothetical protein [Staphylococcus agnetis]MCO4349329.1 hypothetical protein [Staphylococcus agnetis]MCO4351884.1 hypothetical protein [Staphylococcus agnetis]